MDTNKILQDIATNFNKTAEEIRDSNIDDIFQDEPDELIGYAGSIYPLSDYLEKHLPEGYDIEIRRQDDDAYALVDINLRKKFIDEFKDMGEDIFVKHKDMLITEVITLDAEHGFDEPDFKKIGDILSKFKLIYDKMEEYQVQHVKENSAH